MAANGQTGPPGNIRLDNQGRPINPNMKTAGGDSLEQRDNNEDSITIYYRMFDSSRIRFLDSSINDYTLRFPLPASYFFLNHPGNAARSVIFQPNTAPGYDPGFHGFDIYQLNLANTRFFNTTRPYTELEYLLGAKSEQTIKILHTQNIRPLWNASFEYRLFNGPGIYKNASSNHSNIRFSSNFLTVNRRYSGNFVFIRNRSKVNENGGLRDEDFIKINNPAYNDRFNVPTWLGGDEAFSTNFFSSSLASGNDYSNQTLLYRHQYDIGQKDSSYNADSVITRRFYPRLRLQHSFLYKQSSFQYNDNFAQDTSVQNIYKNRFGLLRVDTPFTLIDQWRELTNEAAVILFPERNNQEQFLKLGAAFQALKGTFDTTGDNFNSVYLLGEYRNRTRNRKWDINAQGKFFVTGPYAGNFTAGGTIQTDLGSKLGKLSLGFQNSLRTPSFVFDERSNFILQNNLSLNNENWTTLSADLFINRLGLILKGRYYLISNYTYWTEYAEATQDATLQNVLHLSGEKKFKLSRRWNLYAELHVQQSSSSGINLPFVYTRNQIAYEGNFYKNLFLSTGLEFRYTTPFTPDDWSPFNGQWVPQSDSRIKNLPDVAAFLHFRITSFRAFIRVENLNTFDPGNGFNWTNNNFVAPFYANPGLITRVGFYWTFVN